MGSDLEVAEDLHQTTINIIVITTYVASILYIVFAFESYFYISLYREISLLDNIWPRIIFCSIPFIILGVFVQRSKLSPNRKLSLWIPFYCIVNSVSGWIYILPTASEHPSLMLYFSSINSVIFVTIPILLNFTTRLMIQYITQFWLLFVIPLLLVVSSDRTMIIHTVQVFIFDTLLIFGLQYSNYKIRYRKAAKIIDQDKKIGKFMDDIVYNHIKSGHDLDKLEFDNFGFLMAIDIRGYTNLFKNDKPKATGLIRETHKLVHEVIRKYGGRVHKTFGDGFLCYFMENQEQDVDEYINMGDSTQINRNHLFRDCLRSFDEIMSGFRKIKEGLDLPSDMDICAGIDFGLLTFVLVGDGESLEFDMFSDVLPRSNRLEEFSKVLRKLHKPGSYAVISQDAFSFFDPSLLKIEIKKQITNLEPTLIRDYNEIECIYYTDFNSIASLFRRPDSVPRYTSG